jgi:hypothetical protein
LYKGKKLILTVGIDRIIVVRQNNLETKGAVHESIGFPNMKSMKGESIKMNKLKKVFVLVLVAAVVSLGLTGCKQKNEQPAEGTPSSEHPAASEHPSSEHPTEETPAEEKEAEETPAGEHPTGEHPK